jgi:hypothetical protein
VEVDEFHFVFFLDERLLFITECSRKNRFFLDERLLFITECSRKKIFFSYHVQVQPLHYIIACFILFFMLTFKVTIGRYAYFLLSFAEIAP